MKGKSPKNIAEGKNLQQVLDIFLNPPPVLSFEERAKMEREKKGSKEKKGDVKKNGKSHKNKANRCVDSCGGCCGKHAAKHRHPSGVHWSPYGCGSFTPLEVSDNSFAIDDF